MRPATLLITATLIALTAGCGGGGKSATTNTTPHTTTSSSGSGEATLRRAIRSTLVANRRVSIYVLWNNKLPPWANQSTRGPALTSLRNAAQTRQKRGVRVRVLASSRQVVSIRLDPSFTRATAIVVDRQRVQPSRPNGKPLGHAVVLNERARYELRRPGRGDRFLVWKVVLLK